MDERVRDEMVVQAIAYAQERLGHDRTGHGMDHAERVARMARRIADEEGVDPLLPVMAAYLHDTVDDKLVADSARALEELRAFLGGLGLSGTDVEDLLHTVSRMSFAESLDAGREGAAADAAAGPAGLSSAGHITQDADRLDAIGAIGVTRAIYFGGAHGERIYDPAVSPRQNLTREEYRNLDNETIYNHFYEKLLGLKDTLNTPSARRIAERRQRFMLDYLAEFKAEWEGLA